MNKLTENYFQSGNVLYADDLNLIISQINGVIDGYSPYNDSEIRQLITGLDNSIQQLNNTANAEKDRLDGVIDDIDTTIQDRIDQMMQDKDFLDELKEGIQSSSNFGDEDVDQYLQQIGLITRDGNTVSYGWSTIQQDVNSIRQSVNNLIETGVDTTAIQSQINQYVDDAVANLDISTMYAKKDAESIIEWMYSALKQSTSADKTFTQIASAGKDGLSSAISELRTYVEKLKNGDYVATASLEASVDDAIAGLKASASSNSAKTEIFNKIDKNSQDIAGIVTSLTGNTSSAAISTKIGQWKAGLVTESYVDNATSGLASTNYVNNTVNSATSGLASTDYVNGTVNNATSGLASTGYVNNAVSNGTSGLASTDYVNNRVSGAVAGLMAANDFTAAAIVARVNNAGSDVKISADHVNISGADLTIDASKVYINGNTLASGNATIEGNIKAKSLQLARDFDINNGCVQIQSDQSNLGGFGSISITESGNSSANNIYVSLDNHTGLHLDCAENSHGETGSFSVGMSNNGDFRISTTQGSQGGNGYTGTISGAKFVNGICVGRG